MDKIIRRGRNKDMMVSFTFDDGPHPEYTPRILDILKKFNLKSTFFVVGESAKKYPDIVKRIKDEGSEVGNHTYSHRMLPFQFKKSMVSEIKKTEDIIFNITGEKPRYFRPPRGLRNKFAVDFLQNEGYTIVSWSISSRDWIISSAQKIEDRILKLTSPGSIILFHDAGSIFLNYGRNRLPTVEALPGIINGLKNKGYEIVSLRKILGEEK